MPATTHLNALSTPTRLALSEYTATLGELAAEHYPLLPDDLWETLRAVPLAHVRGTPQPGQADAELTTRIAETRKDLHLLLEHEQALSGVVESLIAAHDAGETERTRLRAKFPDNHAVVYALAVPFQTLGNIVALLGPLWSAVRDSKEARDIRLALTIKTKATDVTASLARRQPRRVQRNCQELRTSANLALDLLKAVEDQKNHLDAAIQTQDVLRFPEKPELPPALRQQEAASNTV